MEGRWVVETVRTDPYFCISLVSDMTWLISLHLLICKVKFILFIPLNCCCCSVTQSCPSLATPGTAARQASLSFTISQHLLKPMYIKSVRPPNHLILCHPLLLWPSIFPSIRLFSNGIVFKHNKQ